MGSRYVVFDLETTGLSPKAGDRVIEIGAVVVEKGRLGAEFHSLVHTEQPMHWAARKVHGISPADLAAAPLAAEIFPVFREFIGDSPLIAHNLPFDLRFLASELSRFSLAPVRPGFCTLQLSRKLYPALASRRLEDLARYLLGSEIVNGSRLHRALADARLTAHVWFELETSVAGR